MFRGGRWVDLRGCNIYSKGLAGLMSQGATYCSKRVGELMSCDGEDAT